MSILRFFVCFVLASAACVAGADMPSQRYAIAAADARFTLRAPSIDRAAALAHDAQLPKSARLRYALRHDVGDVSIGSAGEWSGLPDGMTLWRLPVRADNAVSLDFGFRDFFLPPGAQLFIGNDTGQLRGFDESDNPRTGKFWTPLVYGDSAQIEVLLPQSMKPYVRLDIAAVNVGYRDIFHRKSLADPGEGSGTCNVDTICSQGDAWRSQINAEAVVVVSGGFCSGQLLNDTNNDHAPLLSTANHCIGTQDDADSLVVYWKYESPTCRAIGSAADGDPISAANAIAQTGGSQLLATYQPADFTLVRLRTNPPAAASAFWNGWDRSQNVFAGGAVMHHPSSDAKRISFPAGTVTLDDTDHGQDFVPGMHHWRVDHYSLGTTEEGSSGSGLLDANHHVRGVLSGGSALCSEPDGDDYYGRLSTAWEGGGTASSRMRDWLDPVGAQPQSIDGVAGCVAPVVTLATSAPLTVAGDRITISASASGGHAPYTYAFDLDGDGVADSLDPNAPSLQTSYPGSYSGNISVAVTDSTGCIGSASRAQIVQAQNVSYVSQGIPGGPAPLLKICGGAGDMQPGERFDGQLLLVNIGTTSTSNGYAVFAQDLSQSNATKLTLETPAIALPTLAPGEQTTVDVTFATAPDAACGSTAAIDYLGTADDNGFTPNRARTVLSFVSAQCQPQACVAQTTPLAFKQGNYFDPKRGGNGITVDITSRVNSDPLFFGAWFTGDSARDPTWYVFSDSIHANQVNTTLYKTHQTAPGVFPAVNSAVGSAQVTYVATNTFVYTWQLGDTAGGGAFIPVVSDPNSSLRAWYNPSESGWGTFDELFPSAGSNGLPFFFSLAYIYDANGAPRWTVASNASYRDGVSLLEQVSRPACPGCVWLDYTIGAQSVGSFQYQFSGANGTISSTIALPSSYAGSWNRTNLPIFSLIAP